MAIAISFWCWPARRPSAMAMRSSWSRKRGEIGPGSEIITPPASRNHSDPQLVDTPTRRAAAAPIWPSRTSSKYPFFTEPGIWLEPPRGIGASHRATFATTDRTQAVYPVIFIDCVNARDPRRAGRQPADLRRAGGHRRGDPRDPRVVGR